GRHRYRNPGINQAITLMPAGRMLPHAGVRLSLQVGSYTVAFTLYNRSGTFLFPVGNLFRASQGAAVSSPPAQAAGKPPMKSLVGRDKLVPPLSQLRLFVKELIEVGIAC